MHVRVKRRPCKGIGALQFIVAESRRTPRGPRSFCIASWTSDDETGPNYVISIAEALDGAEARLRDAAALHAFWMPYAAEAAAETRPHYRVVIESYPWKPKAVLREASSARRRWEAAVRKVERLRVANAALPGWRWPDAVSEAEHARLLAITVAAAAAAKRAENEARARRDELWRAMQERKKAQPR